MTKEEFTSKLKSLQFEKTISANNAHGYTTTLTTPSGKSTFNVTCYGMPGAKSKEGLKLAWRSMLRYLAEYWGYEGPIESFE